MAITRLGQLPQQYSQFLADFKSSKSSVAVDTITTRFLLLFLFLLAIPICTVIIFTVSLLAGHMDEAANNQMAMSRNLFDGTMAQADEHLALLEQENSWQLPNATPTFSQMCASSQKTLCMVLNYQAGQARFGDGQSMPVSIFKDIAPEISPALQKNLDRPQFYAHWMNQLYLFRKSSAGNPDLAEVFRGYPVNDSLLNRIYRQNSGLHTEIWVLEEPAQQAQQPLWLARSPKSRYRIPVQPILARLQDPRQNHPITLEIGQESYRILQQPIYTLDNRHIARVVHILPLTENQLLLKNYYLGIYIISVASLIFSILLAMAAGRTITQPLLKLISQVNTLSRENVMRDTDEVSVTGVYEIRQLGEAFNRMVKRLRQEHTMKDEFVATLTHDLKVPLLAEKQTLTYFKGETYGPLTAEQAEVLDILQSSNRSCLSLVNGLLEVYRYDSGEVSLVFETFNLLKLLQETVGELQSLAREKSITLEVSSPLTPEANDITDEDSAMIYADRLEIKRVLHNLVSNAVTNTPIHGTIRCAITDMKHHGSNTVYKVSGFQHTTLKYPVKLSDRLLVIVQDSGIGFASEDLPHLFKQFAASKGRNPMSIGLGLYNCYQVIQAHNGALWVESTEGEGSVVSFVLPTNKQTAQDRRVYRDRRRHA